MEGRQECLHIPDIVSKIFTKLVSGVLFLRSWRRTTAESYEINPMVTRTSDLYSQILSEVGRW